MQSEKSFLLQSISGWYSPQDPRTLRLSSCTRSIQNQCVVACDLKGRCAIPTIPTNPRADMVPRAPDICRSKQSTEAAKTRRLSLHGYQCLMYNSSISSTRPLNGNPRHQNQTFLCCTTFTKKTSPKMLPKPQYALATERPLVEPGGQEFTPKYAKGMHPSKVSTFPTFTNELISSRCLHLSKWYDIGFSKQ